MSTEVDSADIRILIFDDSPGIHADFAKVFAPRDSQAGTGLSNEMRQLLGLAPVAGAQRTYSLASAFQGEEGCSAVAEACRGGRPFHVAIVDVRMPPGINGVETMRRLVDLDPELQLVLCTAYSDVPFEEIEEEFGSTGRVRMIRKPVDPDAVRELIEGLVEVPE